MSERISRRRSRGGCGGRILNFLALVIAITAVLFLCGLVLLLAAPNTFANTPLAPLTALTSGETPEIELPTRLAAAVVPTVTPTATRSLLLEPTWTPRSPVQVDIPSPFPTNTIGPSPTPTTPPFIPTRTPTPTATNTPTPTPTDTPEGPTLTPSPTRSQFPFTRSDISPFYTQYWASNVPCDQWMGVAGEVLDINRNPVMPGLYRVHVWGSGVDERPLVGGAPTYNPLSGWEQFLAAELAVRTYNVQLETANGTAVSQVYTFQTRATCEQNLVRFNFVQNHE
jgi:hypothetical protein